MLKLKCILKSRIYIFIHVYMYMYIHTAVVFVVAVWTVRGAVTNLGWVQTLGAIITPV